MGSCFAGQKKKCLQICAMQMLRDDVRERVAQRLREECCNNEASGYGSGDEARRNFEVVQEAFVQERIYAKVYEAESVEKNEAQDVSGYWILGDP